MNNFLNPKDKKDIPLEVNIKIQCKKIKMYFFIYLGSWTWTI